MASIENQFFLDASAQFEEWLDLDQLIDLTPSYSDDYSASAPSISPSMSIPYEAEILANNLSELAQPGFPEMTSYNFSHDGFFADQSSNAGFMHDQTPIFDDAAFTGYQPYDTTIDFRQIVEARAAADSSVASIKEKRREAAIALHLQRLCDQTALDLDMSSDSNTSFSSPCWSDYMQESISPNSTSVASPEQVSAPTPSGNGGMEMVLDLNMNATTKAPKKQKPRSQAQKENYIKARKYGACEKHKKQHKRCNCLEKAAAAGVPNSFCDVPMDVAYRERVQLPSSKMSGVPSPRLSGVGVPGNHRPESLPSVQPNVQPHAQPNVQPNVQPMVSVTRKVTSDSPMTSPSTNPAVVQPITRTKTRTTSNSPGHDPQYSASFVVSPTDTGKTSNSVGHDPWPHTSRAQRSNASAKSAGLPAFRCRTVGCSPDKMQTSTFSRHIVTTDLQQRASVVHSNARKPDRGETTSSHVLEVIARHLSNSYDAPRSSSGRNAAQQGSLNSLQAREGIPSGLEVHRPKQPTTSRLRTQPTSVDPHSATVPSSSLVQNSLQQSSRVRNGPTAAGLAMASTLSLCPNNKRSSLQTQEPGLSRLGTNVVATRLLSVVQTSLVTSAATQIVSACAQTINSVFGLIFGRSRCPGSTAEPAFSSHVSNEETTFSVSRLLLSRGLQRLQRFGIAQKTPVRWL